MYFRLTLVSSRAHLLGSPQLRIFRTDGRAQQREAPGAQRLCLIDPGDPKPLERFDRLGRVILKSTENDEAVARRLDPVAIELESAADAERGDLAFDQPLARLRQRPLRLADADRQRAALGLAGLDQPKKCDLPDPRPP